MRVPCPSRFALGLGLAILAIAGPAQALHRGEQGLPSRTLAPSTLSPQGRGQGEGPTHLTKQVMVLLCKRVSRRIGRRLHPHLFRHPFATELLNRRADLRVIPCARASIFPR